MFESPSLIETATRIAVDAHKKQVRKGDGSPYIVHPFMCATMLLQHGFNENVISASLVHDVLEDTDMEEQALRKELGDEVVDIVVVVSEDKSLSWEERKEAYVEAVRHASFEAKAVSIVDKMHNVQSVLFSYEKQGQKIWNVFNRGKEKKLWFEELCLQMFQESFDHPLVREYEVLVGKLRTLM
jgi:(p)ppGpp synthase/HD superfamily hydrolase